MKKKVGIGSLSGIIQNLKSKVENGVGLSPSLSHSLSVELWPRRSSQRKFAA